MHLPRETRSSAQKAVLGSTLAAVVLLVGVLGWAQRPAPLPERYQELDLPVTGLH